MTLLAKVDAAYTVYGMRFWDVGDGHIVCARDADSMRWGRTYFYVNTGKQDDMDTYGATP